MSRRSAAKMRLDTLFADTAAGAPDAVALFWHGGVTSYAELDRRANRLANHLRGLGVDRESLVGICLERSPDLVVALLAVLKAGGAYVPLDPAYPDQRLDFMLEDSGSRLLVSRGALAGRLRYDGRLLDLDLDAEGAAIAAQPATPPPQSGDGGDLAYVLYTSGSTGQPKGVMLRHSAVLHIEWARQAFGPEDLARVAATSSICFDPSIFEIFAPLCTGGAIVLKDHLLEPFRPNERPTLLQGVPSVLHKLAKPDTIPDSVRVINIGGEVLDAELPQRLYEVSRVERIYNHYGPTEATTCATVAPIARGDDRAPSIGRPIHGAILYVLDAEGRPAMPGVTGELHIGGDRVAAGYLGDPELTERLFIPDPARPGHLMYRTGDLGRRLPSGEIEFVGRTGDQVKLRGVRIELGEVDAALQRLPGVRRGAAAIRLDPNGRDSLVGYVESAEAWTISAARRALGAWLPASMLPSSIVTLEALPLTASGKVDRAALPALERRKFARETDDTYLKSPVEIIARVFQRALNLPYVGPDEHFFELGGDSLLAADVALQLEALLGQTVAPELLFSAGTPESLAIALDERTRAGSSHLTVLQPSGDNPPLFCLPGLGGRTLVYMRLARLLAPDQPVYGLTVGPLADALIARPAIDGATAAYAAEIRRIQPHGPYRLAGYSFAGLIAFDLACALEAEGEEVLLILLDSRIKHHLPTLGQIAAWAVREAPRFVRRAGWGMGRRIVDRARPAPPWVAKDDLLSQGMARARGNYRYRPFSGSALLVACEESGAIEALLNFDGMLGWRGLLTGPVRTMTAPTNHVGLLRDPYVHELAGILRRALTVARAPVEARRHEPQVS